MLNPPTAPPPQTLLQRALQRPVLAGLLLCLLMPLVAQLGRTQAMPALGSSWIWPGSGLALVYLWVYGRQYWPLLFLSLLLTLWPVTLSHPLLYLVNPALNTLAAWLAVRMMGTLKEQHQRGLARSLWGLLLWGVLAATVVRSGLNALTLVLLDTQIPQLWTLRWPAWGMSSALGVLLVAVPVMAWLLRLGAGRSDNPARRDAQGARDALPWMLLPLLLEALRLRLAPDSPWDVPALLGVVLLQLLYSWRFGGGWGSLLVLAIAALIGWQLPTALPQPQMLPLALEVWAYVSLLGLLNLAVMLVQAHWGTRLDLLQQGLRGGGVVAWSWAPQSQVYASSGDWQGLLGSTTAPQGLADLLAHVHPDDRAALQATHQQRLQGGAALRCEFRVVDADGRIRWLRETGEVVRRDAHGQPLHVAGLLQDVSASLEAREALALSEQRYRTLSSVAPVGVFQSQPDGHCLYVNAEYAALFGTTPEQCLGFGWTRHLIADDTEDALASWRAATAAGQRFEGESRFRRSDGSEIWVMARAQPVFDAEGRVASYVGSLTDISEQKAQQELIWTQAHVDALTSLPNRRLFVDRLEQALQRAERQGERLALLYLDLDRFKEVNDTLGHAVGDRLLVAAAQRIRDCVRASDTTARLGGDEFTVILTDLQGPHPVDSVAGKLVAALAEPFKLGSDTVYVSASIGITLYPEDGRSVGDLMKHADQALYRAKAEGRNRFGFFTAAMQAQAQLALALSQELRAALGSQQLCLHYQPIVELASGRVVKAEALLRWQHPLRGDVSPAQFIPIAEESELIHAVGDWVFEQAALMAVAWRQQHGGLLPINVNKSPRQFLAGDHAERWPALLQQHGLPGSAICIEITEGLLLDDRPDVAQRMRALAEAGLPFALDDFGTGYSALGYLTRFPIQQLKIDRSFVHGMTERPADLAIVEAIVLMAHKLGLQVVAEGVETEAQAALLRAAGCDYAQGWLFGRPLPGAALLELGPARLPHKVQPTPP